MHANRLPSRCSCTCCHRSLVGLASLTASPQAKALSSNGSSAWLCVQGHLLRRLCCGGAHVQDVHLLAALHVSVPGVLLMSANPAVVQGLSAALAACTQHCCLHSCKQQSQIHQTSCVHCLQSMLCSGHSAGLHMALHKCSAVRVHGFLPALGMSSLLPAAGPPANAHLSEAGHEAGQLDGHVHTALPAAHLQARFLPSCQPMISSPIPCCSPKCCPAAGPAHAHLPSAGHEAGQLDGHQRELPVRQAPAEGRAVLGRIEFAGQR